MGNPWWRIQPLRTLQIPPVFYGLSGAVFLVGLSLNWAARQNTRHRIAGMGFIGLALVMAAPILAAPVVNRFEYARYQFVRGQLDSPIGLYGVLALTVSLGIVCLLPSVRPRSSNSMERRSAPQGAFLALPLLAASAACVGSLVGSSGGSVCALLAFDAETGTLVWQTVGLASKAIPKSSGFNSLASPTPVVCAELVAGYFGERGAFACERDTGALRWTYRDLPYSSAYGAGSSLAAVPGGVVVQSDSDAGVPSYVVALASANGRPMWKHDRTGHASWRTPAVFTWEGRTIVCSWGVASCDFLAGDSGERLAQLHRIDCSDGDPVCSPVIALPLVCFAGTERLIGVHISEVLKRAGEQRLDLGDAGVSLEQERQSGVKPVFVTDLQGDGPTCSTPTVSDRLLFVCSDRGVLSAFDRQTGKPAWRTQVGACKSSPVIANEHLFIANEKGELYVFSLTGPEPLLVGTLEFGEKVVASPCVHAGRLFLRTQTRLHCICAGLDRAIRTGSAGLDSAHYCDNPVRDR